MKRITALILAITFILSMFCSVNAVYAESNGDLSVENNAYFETANESDYQKYLNKFNNYEFAKEDIVVDINKDLLTTSPIKFEFTVPSEGMYTLGITYKALENDMRNYLEIGCQIDDVFPYSEAEKLPFPKMWKDATEKRNSDANGNEYSPTQIVYDEFYLNNAIDVSSDEGNPYTLYLSAGKHTCTIFTRNENLAIKSVGFYGDKSVQKYSKPNDNEKIYNGDSIVIEGEDAIVKSGYSVVGKNDSSTTAITPHDATRKVINYIGGGNWKSIGEEIVWETPELKEGYYSLGFVFRQNTIIGGRVYRSLKIDGKTPFAEADEVSFSYDDNWQSSIFGEADSPYYIYLSKGKHKISLTVSSGRIAEVTEGLKSAVAKLSDLYLDITMITGENVDVYRDYELFNQIPTMEEDITEIKNLLSDSVDRLMEITGERSGSQISVINNMIEIIEQMLNNKFNAHRYVSSYYSNYCSVSSVLKELKNMPLDIDKLILFSPEEKNPIDKSGFFENVMFSIERFISSFVRDYNGISDTNDENSITIWVNWGRDQAQVLASLIDSSFTPKTGISVNLQLVNASIVQATLSGKGPDCILQHSRSEPVNLAMRGVLYDLAAFEDCDNVLTRFQNGAEKPYRYKDGLYALPDTQTFFVMFYRKDILNKFNLSVPQTWDDFKECSKLLMRRNMSVWIHNSPATDVAQTNAGVGSINIFPSLLMQNGVSLYAENGKSTNLLAADTMEIFGEWTDYYRKMKFPVTQDFYNRFRTGTTPLGISSYTMYTTLKVAAPEIDGLWSIAPIPGTVKEDGTIDHTSSGGGSACAILKSSKNPEGAWEFLKWWTDTNTQLTYSNNIESILGAAGRVAVSNVEALKSLSWEEDILKNLLLAWESVEEVPEYPGSYYVSRSVYQSFWNVVNDNQNTKDMLMKYGKEADEEINRKWKQYSNRK